MGMRRLRYLALVAGVSVLAACGGGDNDATTAVPEGSTGSSSSGAAGAPVMGTTWAVSEVNVAQAAIAASADAEAYLQIQDDGKVQGNTGCNGFGGTAEVGSEAITFSPLISTKMACEGDIGAMDSAMLQVLRGEVTFEVAGDVMTLTNASGDTLALAATDDVTPSP